MYLKYYDKENVLPYLLAFQGDLELPFLLHDPGRKVHKIQHQFMGAIDGFQMTSLVYYLVLIFCGICPTYYKIILKWMKIHSRQYSKLQCNVLIMTGNRECTQTRKTEFHPFTSINKRISNTQKILKRYSKDTDKKILQ